MEKKYIIIAVIVVLAAILVAFSIATNSPKALQVTPSVSNTATPSSAQVGLAGTPAALSPVAGSGTTSTPMPGKGPALPGRSVYEDLEKKGLPPPPATAPKSPSVAASAGTSTSR